MLVAIGIIQNSQGELLIANRPPNKSHGGLWEFPGGKVEIAETVFQAIQRELLEEIGIHVVAAEPWLQVEYSYEDKAVFLDAWLVTNFSGEPEGREGQSILWVPPNMLTQFEFPKANQPLIDKCLNFANLKSTRL